SSLPADCLTSSNSTELAFNKGTVENASSRLSPVPFSGLAAAIGCPLADDREALTRQVKEANDIVDVVGGYVSLRPAGDTFKGLCPFHQDQRPSFDVSSRRQRYRCWACGKHGDVFTFIQEMEHVSFPEALELLARRAGISLEKFKFSHHNATRAPILHLIPCPSHHFP